MSNALAVAPQNMQEAMQLATLLSTSSMVPKSYAGKEGDTLVAMMMGNEIGLNPIQALQNIAVINGKPSIYGDALTALIQNHPKYGGMEESFDEATMTATCTVWRKDGPKHTQTFSQADAATAGLWGKTGPWKQYPKRMLQMRARGFAVRGQFGDALAGLITREEAEDMPQEAPQEKDITPTPDAAPTNDAVISPDQAAAVREALGKTSITERELESKAGVGSIEMIQARRYNALMAYLAQHSQEINRIEQEVEANA